MGVQETQGRWKLGRSSQNVGQIRAHIPRTPVTLTAGGKEAVKASSLSGCVHLGRGQEHS